MEENRVIQRKTYRLTVSKRAVVRNVLFVEVKLFMFVTDACCTPGV